MRQGKAWPPKPGFTTSDLQWLCVLHGTSVNQDEPSRQERGSSATKGGWARILGVAQYLPSALNK